MIIDDLVRGSIDMHVHHAPCTLIPGRMNALDTAKWARQMGMKAIVLKSSDYPTAPLAGIVNELVPEVKVIGSICLDYEIGGLNFHALEFSAKAGAKMAWMPTHSSSNSIAKERSLLGWNIEGEGLSILNSEHKLVPEMGRLLSLIKEHNMVLANGHISPRETFALVEMAQKIGISKIVITHALWTNGRNLLAWKNCGGWDKWEPSSSTAMLDFSLLISGMTRSRWWKLLSILVQNIVSLALTWDNIIIRRPLRA